MNKKPTNWIHGLSVEERKKQGITTVQPLVQPKDVEVDHSHYKKLQVLSNTMNDWEKNNGRIPMDSQRGRMFESDLSRVMDLMKDGLSTEGKDYLSKEEMLEMNMLYRLYKVTNGEVPYAEQIERAKKMVNDQ